MNQDLRSLTEMAMLKNETTKYRGADKSLVRPTSLLKDKRHGKVTNGGSCSYTTMLRLTGHLQHRRKWSTWASIVLFPSWSG
jgi:hypothetical protein